MKKLILFLTLLTNTSVFSCGWWPTGEEIRFSLFSQNIGGQDDLAPMFYSSEYFSSYQSNAYLGPKENIESWEHYLEYQFSAEEIDEVVYGIGLNDNFTRYQSNTLFNYLVQLKDEITYLEMLKEYHFLKAKFDLVPLEFSIWKMLRLRPSNFPTIRISQLANLLNQQTRFFSKVISVTNIKELQMLFQIQASVYWDTHYQFGVETANDKTKRLGITTINSIIINVVVPFIFVYGKAKQDEELVEKALKLLESLKTENNIIIKKWSNLGVKSTNAMQSQSLIELKNNYCSQKKCLICSIGNKILQS